MWLSLRSVGLCLLLVGATVAADSHLRATNHRNLQEVTETFGLVGDTFVRESNVNGNYNAVTNLGVAYGLTYSERTTYIKIPIDFALRNAVSITSAKLKMRTNQITGTIAINFYPCDTETWDEAAITWNSRPGFDTNTLLTSAIVEPADLSNYLSFDLTTSVIASAAGGDSTLSVVIEALDLMDGSSQLLKFDSTEDGVNIPFLEVTYVPGQATASPTSAPSSGPTIDYNQPAYPQLVSVGVDGLLDYVPYGHEINVVQGSTANPAAVNTVPDYSAVGYMGGGVPIPFVPVKQVVSICAWLAGFVCLFVFCIVLTRCA